MKTFTPEQLARHAYSDASERVSCCKRDVEQAEKRIAVTINRNKRNPHPLWEAVIAQEKAKLVPLRAALATARQALEDARENLPLLDLAA